MFPRNTWDRLRVKLSWWSVGLAHTKPWLQHPAQHLLKTNTLRASQLQNTQISDMSTHSPREDYFLETQGKILSFNTLGQVPLDLRGHYVL